MIERDAVEYTLFRDRWDLRPQQAEGTWFSFSDMFRVPRRTPCSVADCRHRGCAHKDGPAWSPAIYPSEVLRLRCHVEAVALFVVDLDHLTDEQLATAAVRFAPFRRIVHSTHSDRRSDRCARAIVALSRSVMPDEWSAFWRAATSLFEHSADLACRDIGRIYYLPSCSSDAENYHFEAHDGLLLDVDTLLVTAPTMHEREIAQ